MKLPFQEFKNYLYNNNIFGFTALRRKHSIIYFFRRYFLGLELSLKIKVDNRTKQVISVMCGDKIYTDFNDLKKIIEKKWK